MFDGQLDRCIVKETACCNRWPLSNQSDTRGIVMANSNSNTASVKSKRPKLTEEERKERSKVWQKTYREKNKEKIAKKNKAWQKANKDKRAASARKHYHANKEVCAERNLAWRQANPDKCSQHRKKYYKSHKAESSASNRKWVCKNRDKVSGYSKKWYLNNKQSAIAASNAWDKRQKEKDPTYRFLCALRNRMSTCLLGKYKTGSAVRDMGCTGQQARDHLESLFDDHMTWENYGTYWHVDHIYPLNAANIEDRIEFLAVNNWRNLQPLEKVENIRKKDKVTPEAQELFNSLKEEFSERIAA